MQQHIEIMSALLKSISHPIRLQILCLLLDRELTVGDIRKEVRTTDANISQHLTILRNQGIIGFRKESNFIYNKIIDRRIVELIAFLEKTYCPSDG